MYGNEPIWPDVLWLVTVLVGVLAAAYVLWAVM